MSLQATGLISGLDVNSIIEDLITAESAPRRRLEDRQQILAAQQETLRNLNSSLLILQSRATGLADRTATLQKTVTSSDDGVITATATTSAARQTHGVQISQFATASRVSSASTVSKPVELSRIVKIYTGSFTVDALASSISVTGTTSLNDIATAISGLSATDTTYASTYNDVKFSLTKNITNSSLANPTSSVVGKTFTFAETDTSFTSATKLAGTTQTIFSVGSGAGLASTTTLGTIGVGGIDGGKFSINGQQFTVPVQLKSTQAIAVLTGDTVLTTGGLGIASKSFNINGFLFAISEGDTVQDLVNQINQHSSVGVTASITGDGQLQLSADDPLPTTTITLADNTGGDFVSRIGFANSFETIQAIIDAINTSTTGVEATLANTLRSTTAGLTGATAVNAAESITINSQLIDFDARGRAPINTVQKLLDAINQNPSVDVIASLTATGQIQLVHQNTADPTTAITFTDGTSAGFTNVDNTFQLKRSNSPITLGAIADTSDFLNKMGLAIITTTLQSADLNFDGTDTSLVTPSAVVRSGVNGLSAASTLATISTPLRESNDTMLAGGFDITVQELGAGGTVLATQTSTINITDPASTTLQDIIDRINAASLGGLTATLPTTGQFAGQLVLTAQTRNIDVVTLANDLATTPAPATPDDLSTKFLKILGLKETTVTEGNFAGFTLTPTIGKAEINGVELTVDLNTTIGDLTAEINSSTFPNLVADYDPNTDRFKISTETGIASHITLGAADDTSNILAVLNLSETSQIVTGTAELVGFAPMTADIGSGTAAQSFDIVNGQNFVLNGTQVTILSNATGSNQATLQEAINSINRHTDETGVTASLNNSDGKLKLSRDNGTTIELANGTLDVFSSLRLQEEDISLITSQNVLESVTRVGGIDPIAALSDVRLALGTIAPSGTFKINSIEISYTSDDTLQNIIDRLNSSAAGVTASYNSIADTIDLVSNTTGSALIKLESVSVGTINLINVGIDGGRSQDNTTVHRHADAITGTNTDTVDYGYFVDGADLNVYDTTNVTTPTTVNEVTLAGTIQNIAIKDGESPRIVAINAGSGGSLTINDNTPDDALINTNNNVIFGVDRRGTGDDGEFKIVAGNTVTNARDLSLSPARYDLITSKVTPNTAIHKVIPTTTTPAHTQMILTMATAGFKVGDELLLTNTVSGRTTEVVIDTVGATTLKVNVRNPQDFPDRAVFDTSITSQGTTVDLTTLGQRGPTHGVTAGVTPTLPVAVSNARQATAITVNSGVRGLFPGGLSNAQFTDTQGGVQVVNGTFANPTLTLSGFLNETDFDGTDTFITQIDGANLRVDATLVATNANQSTLNISAVTTTDKFAANDILTLNTAATVTVNAVNAGTVTANNSPNLAAVTSVTDTQFATAITPASITQTAVVNVMDGTKFTNGDVIRIINGSDGTQNLTVTVAVNNLTSNTVEDLEGANQITQIGTNVATRITQETVIAVAGNGSRFTNGDTVTITGGAASPVSFAVTVAGDNLTGPTSADLRGANRVTQITTTVNPSSVTYNEATMTVGAAVTKFDSGDTITIAGGVGGTQTFALTAVRGVSLVGDPASANLIGADRITQIDTTVAVTDFVNGVADTVTVGLAHIDKFANGDRVRFTGGTISAPLTSVISNVNAGAGTFEITTAEDLTGARINRIVYDTVVTVSAVSQDTVINVGAGSIAKFENGDTITIDGRTGTVLNKGVTSFKIATSEDLSGNPAITQIVYNAAVGVASTIQTAEIDVGAGNVSKFVANDDITLTGTDDALGGGGQLDVDRVNGNRLVVTTRDDLTGGRVSRVAYNAPIAVASVNQTTTYNLPNTQSGALPALVRGSTIRLQDDENGGTIDLVVDSLTGTTITVHSAAGNGFINTARAGFDGTNTRITQTNLSDPGNPGVLANLRVTVGTGGDPDANFGNQNTVTVDVADPARFKNGDLIDIDDSTTGTGGTLNTTRAVLGTLLRITAGGGTGRLTVVRADNGQAPNINLKAYTDTAGASIIELDALPVNLTLIAADTDNQTRIILDDTEIFKYNVGDTFAFRQAAPFGDTSLRVVSLNTGLGADRNELTVTGASGSPGAGIGSVATQGKMIATKQGLALDSRNQRVYIADGTRNLRGIDGTSAANAANADRDVNIDLESVQIGNVLGVFQDATMTYVYGVDANGTDLHAIRFATVLVANGAQIANASVTINTVNIGTQITDGSIMNFTGNTLTDVGGKTVLYVSTGNTIKAYTLDRGGNPGTLSVSPHADLSFTGLINTVEDFTFVQSSDTEVMVYITETGSNRVEIFDMTVGTAPTTLATAPNPTTGIRQIESSVTDTDLTFGTDLFRGAGADVYVANGGNYQVVTGGSFMDVVFAASSQAGGVIQRVDVGNKTTNPSLESNVTIANVGTASGLALDTVATQVFLYTADGTNPITVTDVTDPLAPINTRQINPGTGRVYSKVFAFNGRVFGVSAAGQVDTFTVNTSSGSLTSAVTATTLAGGAFGDSFFDKTSALAATPPTGFLYLSDGASATVSRYNVSSGALDATINLGGVGITRVQDLTVSHPDASTTLLYVTDPSQGDKVGAFNINTPATPTISTLTTISSGSDVFIAKDANGDDVVFVADGQDLKKFSDAGSANAFMSLFNIGEDTGIAGQDVVGRLNGVQFTRNTNDVTDLVPGLTLSVTGATSPGQTVALEVKPDVDGVVESVEGFVDQLNTVQTLIRDNVTARRIFNPTTDEEVVQGALANDPTLRALGQRLLALSVNPVVGTGLSLTRLNDLGISRGAAGTVTVDQVMQGLDLKVNSSTLREAISTNPEAAANIFGSFAQVSTRSSLPISDNTQMLLTVSSANFTSLQSKINATILLEDTVNNGNKTPLTIRSLNSSSSLVTVSGGILDSAKYVGGRAVVIDPDTGGTNVAINRVSPTLATSRTVLRFGSAVDLNRVASRFGQTIEVEDSANSGDRVTMRVIDIDPTVLTATVASFLDTDNYKDNSARIVKVDGESASITLVDITFGPANQSQIRLPASAIGNYAVNDTITVEQGRQNIDLTITAIDSGPIPSFSAIRLARGSVTVGDPTTNITVNANEIAGFVGKSRVTLTNPVTGITRTATISSVDTGTRTITLDTPGRTPDFTGFDTAAGQIIELFNDLVTTRGPLPSLAIADIVVQGVAERMQGVLEGYTRFSTGILDTRFSTITSQLVGLQSDIEDFDQSIQEREGELIREFATLEVALGQLQIQSRFLTAQLTALQNTLTGFRNRRNNR